MPDWLQEAENDILSTRIPPWLHPAMPPMPGYEMAPERLIAAEESGGQPIKLTVDIDSKAAWMVGEYILGLIYVYALNEDYFLKN